MGSPLLHARRPSPLDSPRFFDDEALSGWQVEGKEVAGVKTAFDGAKAFTRSKLKNAPTPEPPHDGDPIGIEIVRGANGPTDETWTIIVDGVRCQRISAVDDPNVFVCKLPRGVALKPLSADTKVRPIAIGLRLEAEALMPLSAEVSLTQVLKTDERDDRGESNEKVITRPVPLKPYRVSDVAVSAVSMPYPFWAPAQSALGLLSLKPVNRHMERKDATQAHNLWANTVNSINKAAYGARDAAFSDLFEREKVLSSVDEQLDLISKLTNQGKSGSTQDDVTRLKSKLKKPEKPKMLVPRHFPKEPKSGSTQSYVIGGKTNSAARELVDILDVLVHACERMREESLSAKKSLSLREQIARMRMELMVNYNDDEALAVLDALMCTRPYPPANYLLQLRSPNVDNSPFTFDDRKNITSAFRRKYVVTNCDEVREKGPSKIGATGDAAAEPEVRRMEEPVAVKDLTDEQRTALNAANDAFLKRENNMESGADEEYNEKLPDYMFVYERLTLEQRMRTTLRSRINVNIVDFDGTSFSVRFEAEEEDGIVAHAVYANLRKDIDDFDLIAQKLTICMFDVYAVRRGVMASIKDGWVEGVQRAAELTFGKYKNARRLETASDGRQFASIEEISKYLTYDWSASLAKQIAGKAPFKLDPCRLEERLAELRLMVRELLPIWPPMPQPEPTEPEPTEPEPTEPEPDTVAFSLEHAVDVADVGVGGVSALDDELQEQKLAKEEEAKLATKLAIINANREADNLAAEQNTPPDENSIVFTEEQSTNVLIRIMPQIVQPAAVLTYGFVSYDFSDVRLNYPPSEAEMWRFGKGLIKLGFTAAAAGSLYLVYTRAFSVILQVVKEDAAWETIFNAFPIVAKISAGLGNPFQWITTAASVSSAAYDVLGYSEIDYATRWQIFSAAAPFAYNMATSTLAFFNRRLELSKLQKNAYNAHLTKLIDKPTDAAIAAARGAVKVFSEALAEAARNAGVLDTASVIYNDVSGKRFAFYEYYESTKEIVEKSKDLVRVHKNEDWAAVPDSNAIRLFPPMDVAEQLYEAETLRGLPLTETITFTAGTIPSISAKNPAELAAKSAHQELMQIVVRQRWLVRGSHLMQSPAQTGLQLVRSATRILLAAYGTNAGITLVRGNDLVWTCARGGVAARLALRHMALFEKAESLLLNKDGNEVVNTALKYWSRPKRAIMDDFVRAWLEEAEYAARAESDSQPQIPPLRLISIEAAQIFARTSALIHSKPGVSVEEKTVVLTTVSSALAHGLFVTTSSGYDLTPEAASFIASAQANAKEFTDQSNMSLPSAASYGSSIVLAAWASRRIAPAMSREMTIGGGAENVTTKLAGLDLRNICGPLSTRRVYYCPMGSRLEATPGRMPFAVDNLSQRVVWLGVLVNAAAYIKSGLKPPTQPVRDKELVIVGRDYSSTVGVARHPLVIVQDGTIIDVPLAEMPNDDDIDKSVSSVGEPSTLLDAIDALQFVNPKSLRKRIAKMRTTAFNAERLLFGLSLASSSSACLPRVHVHLSNPENIMSLVLALAMQQIESGSIAAEISVFVQEHERMQQVLKNTVEQLDKAIGLKCRVCSLAELSMCL